MQMQPYTTDTSDDAWAVQLDGLRSMPPAERIEKMCKLSTNLRRMAMAAIQRRHPQFGPPEIRMKFIELTYGKELADSVRKQLRERELA